MLIYLNSRYHSDVLPVGIPVRHERQEAGPHVGDVRQLHQLSHQQSVSHLAGPRGFAVYQFSIVSMTFNNYYCNLLPPAARGHASTFNVTHLHET